MQIDPRRLPTLEQVRLELTRRRCATLSGFVREAWHVLEPGQPYVHGWHMDAVCEHLEAITKGQITRLLINVPPGTSKSTLVSVMWPAWEWGPAGLPHHRFIGASHDQSLSIRDAMKMRQLVTSDWYQALWPTQLMADQNQKLNFQNTATGFRQACAVTSMTGRRGDCLKGGAIISTDNGDLPIEQIVNKAEACNVLSVEVNTGRVVYRPVEAVARRAAAEIYRVHSSCGRVVECTGDHRIYTARGYVPASLLSPGDVLLRELRNGSQAEHLPDEEGPQERAQRGLLQPLVRPDCGEYPGGQRGAVLQHLRRQDPERAPAVFGTLPHGGASAVDRENPFQDARGGLRALRQDIPSEDARAGATLLRSRLRSEGSLVAHSGREQSAMARGRGCEALRPAERPELPKDSECSAEAGWFGVRLLRRANRPLRAPHGYGHLEQHNAQPGDAVPQLPLDVAHAPAVQTGRTTVTLVERVPGAEVVYDLQVEGTRCFFANGILVHNCVVWDDPLSAFGARSAAERAAAIDVFKETLPTRLNNPDRSAIVVVMQRLHEEDVSGYILSEDFGYEHLCLPMEFEPERRCVTSIGFKDPRTYDGELLFPARFPPEVVERDKKIMGSYAAAGQLQQRPAPRTGGFFAWDQIEIVDKVPPLAKVVRYWDKAGTENGGAYTAGVKMGQLRDGSGWIVLDVVRGQWEAPQRERIMKQTAGVDDPKTNIWYEQEPGSGGKESAQATTRNLAGFIARAERATGDKEVRAEPFSTQMEAGNILMLRAAWNAAYLDELKLFPNGKFKDQVDASSGAFNKLQAPNGQGMLLGGS